jgi:hypothetical protein
MEAHTARSGSDRARQGEHPLHVPRHGHEFPLTADIVEATEQELTESMRICGVLRTGGRYGSNLAG